jgi:hypothetical protein
VTSAEGGDVEKKCGTRHTSSPPLEGSLPVRGCLGVTHTGGYMVGLGA